MFRLSVVQRVGFVGLVMALLVSIPTTALAQFGEPEADSESEDYAVSTPLPDRLCQGVHATGQAECYDEPGNPIGCAETGQDGESQKGFSVDPFPRFTDNGDGTVKDNLTGLIWLQLANCLTQQPWAAALSAANILGHGSCDLTDSSVAGDWRLPNVKELQSLIDFSEASPALPSGHPFSSVATTLYWSSTTKVQNPATAWWVSFAGGNVSTHYKPNLNCGWPVRGGL